MRAKIQQLSTQLENLKEEYADRKKTIDFPQMKHSEEKDAREDSTDDYFLLKEQYCQKRELPRQLSSEQQELKKSYASLPINHDCLSQRCCELQADNKHLKQVRAEAMQQLLHAQQQQDSAFFQRMKSDSDTAC